MTTEEKADLYEDLVYRAGLLENKNSKLKSENTLKIPPEAQKEINENQNMINHYNQRLHSLVNNG